MMRYMQGLARKKAYKRLLRMLALFFLANMMFAVGFYQKDVFQITVRRRKVKSMIRVFEENPHSSILVIQQLPERNITHSHDLWNGECRTYWEEQFRNFTVYLNAIAPDYPLMTHDVSIITHVTPDRLFTLERLYDHWKAPVTVVIYLEKNELQNTTQKLKTWLNTYYQHHVTVHYVIKKGTIFPANFLKNIAQDNAPANYVFYLDTDLVPSAGLYEAITKSIYSGILANEAKSVLAVITFNVMNNKAVIPLTKPEIVDRYEKDVFKFKRWQNNINFDKWLQTSKSYEVNHTKVFEPFLVIRRENSPPYLNYFMDRWQVKVSQVRNIAARHLKFIVLPNEFLVHVEHSRMMENRKNFKCAKDLKKHELKQLLTEERMLYNSSQGKEERMFSTQCLLRLFILTLSILL